MISLADIEKLLARSNDRFLLQRLAADTYKDFVEILNQDIDESICEMEKNPKIRRGQDEDALTDSILIFLKGRGYEATHDTTVGGHGDIVVKHRNGYLWLGEAKKHGTYDWLEQGYKQLTTRYLRGTDKCRYGGVIYYVFTQNCLDVVNKWKQKLTESYEDEIKIDSCHIAPQLGFYTKQNHGSGLELSIRHRAAQLYFDPKA